MNGKLYTIGCSVHTLDAFIKLLRDNEIQVVADVRSVPFSKYTPYFNEKNLDMYLKNSGIRYLSFKSEFGARREEPEAYIDGKVDYEKVKGLELFKQGIERIRLGLSKGFNIALMCTEKDPLDCHRFILVSNAIEKEMDIPVEHILFDGEIETTEEVEDRMLKSLKITADLFEEHDGFGEDEKKKDAYRIIGEKIAFKEAYEGTSDE